MTTTTYKFPQLVNMAIEGLPKWRRNRMKRRYERASDEERAEMNGRILEYTMAKCPCMRIALGSEENALEAEFGLDPENLSEVLSVIIKFLTELAPLIKLFLEIFAAIALMVALSGAANAQQIECKDGTCNLRDSVRVVAGSALRLAASPVVAVANARTNAAACNVCAYGEAQRTVLHTANSQTVCMGSGSQDQHWHPLRSGVGAILHRGRVAAKTIRSRRPVASLFSRTRQATGNLVSAIRPAAIRARVCRRANR